MILRVYDLFLKHVKILECLRITSLVQLVERRFPKPNVEGSSPSGRVYFMIKCLIEGIGKKCTYSYNIFMIKNNIIRSDKITWRKK